MNSNHLPLIAIIGLGYVGLPLAVEFGKIRPTIGFDIDMQRVKSLYDGVDHTLEVDADEISASINLQLSADVKDLDSASIYIITVPTPVDEAKRPDVSALIKASETVGMSLKSGNIVIYESTVFPGCTEEVCVPVLERISGLKFNIDFFCGYSPERINPGDKEHRLPTILKVTSGSTPAIAEKVDALYREIITAGTYLASSIKVAEAAKVIENTQRDVNIALMNELSLIFHRLGIDTIEVLEAAGTKWNFLPFRPGLVGGHCIGVDPYYLTHKAQQVGYHPEVILSGRKINDQMGGFVAENVIKLMLAKGIQLLGSKILMLGLSFKENCPDIRNTRATDIVAAMRGFSIDVDIYDPYVNPEEVRDEFDLECTKEKPEDGQYDAIVVAVGHKQFTDLGVEGVRKLGKNISVIYDVKSIFPRHLTDGRL
jgi:UDP-N-acetyl-D-glucosamine/UDP-N-acetyl-D-galactosamine dehydrogenase